MARDGRGESGSELLVGSEVAGSADIDEALPPPADLVGTRKGGLRSVIGEESVRDRLSFQQPRERLAGPAAGGQDTVVLVEDENELSALFDQDLTPERLEPLVSGRHGR